MAGNYFVRFSDGLKVLTADVQCIALTPEVEQLLATAFPDGTCFFDRQHHAVSAGWPGMTHNHENPLASQLPDRLGPFFSELGDVISLSSVIVGAHLLVLRALGGKYGQQSWWPATVVCDEASVLLGDGKLAAIDQAAVAILEGAEVPCVDFELSADGSAWRRPKKGPPQRLPAFCGREARLGDLVLHGAKTVLIRTAAAPESRWKLAVVTL